MRNLICIVCPKGCHLEIDEKQNVKGNGCNRGKNYAISEVTNPVRTITTTIKVINGKIISLPVRTSIPIPKNMIFPVMEYLNKIVVSAPIKIGDVIVKDILGTKSNIIATRNIEKEN